MLVLMRALEVNFELVCAILCAYRKRTVMSEYGPILDSNNPLSLNSDNPDQGIVMHDNKTNCLSLLCRYNTSNTTVVSLLHDVNARSFSPLSKCIMLWNIGRTLRECSADPLQLLGFLLCAASLCGPIGQPGTCGRLLWGPGLYAHHHKPCWAVVVSH